MTRKRKNDRKKGKAQHREKKENDTPRRVKGKITNSAKRSAAKTKSPVRKEEAGTHVQ